ncbi:MAG: ABC transporter ATP-binding protein [Clostridia bacterium]|nr:ABC transporter ATP-binding protein [Clostridia bacterium]
MAKEKQPKEAKEKKPKPKLQLGTYLSFVKGYRILTILTPIMIFADVLIELQLPKIMGQVIDQIMGAGSEGFDQSALNRRLVEMLLLSFTTVLVGYFAARFSAIASMGFGANMRSALFNKIQDLSFENIDRLKIGSLITRMVSDTSRVQSLFSTFIVTFIKGPFILIMAFIKALNISRQLSQVFWFAVPGIIISLVALGMLAIPMFKKMLEMTDNFNSALRSNIRGIRIVKAFVREDYEKEKFETANMNVAKTNLRAQSLVIYVSPFIIFVIYACMIFTLWRGSGIIIADKVAEKANGLTVGDLTAFTSYISQVLSSLMTVLMVFVSMIVARASITRVSEVLAEEPTINDHAGDPNLKVKDGSIEFCDVSFKYSEEAAKNILEHINLKIESGETVGIIGATGSAKSTLVSLIPRLYDVTEGAVLIGGENVKNYKFQNLRDGVSIVLQQSMLFSGTIAENIRWGKPDATDEEVIAAAKAAQAHDFIMEKEKGYDTELGHGGNTVSGGQRQRLCMARTFVKQPKVLILDDSTSAVDTATDAQIRNILRTDAFAGVTKLIIAQRITSIMDADRIIVIDDGRIDGIGTHADLVENNAIYHEIFMSQQEGVLAQ